MTLLIPAYEPDERLLALIDNIQAITNTPIIIIDDGSGPSYYHLFQTLKASGCTLLTHTTNRGKGCALKTGFQYMKEQGITGEIICADSDGQHLPADILKIASEISQHDNKIILGSRRFTGIVPIRSRFGNSATRSLFALLTGTSIHDTQTGLRGFSSTMLDWLCNVPGERFEYEMNMLLDAGAAGYSLYEVPIDTVYLDHNKSTHFRPIVDSAKVYIPLLKFSASSLLSGIIDFGMLLLIQHASSNLLLSVVGARIFSSLFNYTINRKFVFHKKTSSSEESPANIHRSMPKYFALVMIILLLNYTFMYLFHETIGMQLIFAKVLTETSLFLFSYWSQKKFVY